MQSINLNRILNNFEKYEKLASGNFLISDFENKLTDDEINELIKSPFHNLDKYKHYSQIHYKQFVLNQAEIKYKKLKQEEEEKIKIKNKFEESKNKLKILINSAINNVEFKNSEQYYNSEVHSLIKTYFGNRCPVLDETNFTDNIILIYKELIHLETLI